MKYQRKPILLTVSVLAIFLFSAGGAWANESEHLKVPYVTTEYLKVPYVTNATGWYTGVAVTNLSGSTIPNIYCDFTHQDGSFQHFAAIRDDRADMGEFAPHEMKIFALGDLYPGTLPAEPFWLWFWHSAGGYPFGVAVFISNDFAGIGGYGFQQFTSTNDIE